MLSYKMMIRLRGIYSRATNSCSLQSMFQSTHLFCIKITKPKQTMYCGWEVICTDRVSKSMKLVDSKIIIESLRQARSHNNWWAPTTPPAAKPIEVLELKLRISLGNASSNCSRIQRWTIIWKSIRTWDIWGVSVLLHMRLTGPKAWRTPHKTWTSRGPRRPQVVP